MTVMKFGGTSVADQRRHRAADRASCAPSGRPTRRPKAAMRAGRSWSCRRCPASPIACSASRRSPAIGRRRRRAHEPAAICARGIIDGRRRSSATPSLRSRSSMRSTREFDELERVVHALGGAARGVAALARRGRGDRRARQQPDRRRGVRRRTSCPRAWVDARTVLVTDDEHTAAAPDMVGDRPRALDDARRIRRWPPAACRCSAASSARRATASPPRSAAAARTTRRRSSAPASAPPRSRSGPTSTAC